MSASGIECPICGSTESKVLETRRHPKALTRQRECSSIRKHRFFTVELVADDDGLPSTTPDDAFAGFDAVAWRMRHDESAWVPCPDAAVAAEMRVQGWEVQALGVIPEPKKCGYFDCRGCEQCKSIPHTSKP